MTTSGVIRSHAPAKINLSLHVTGQRSDGYHLLDSLVMFTQMGDVITAKPADTLSLTIDGPFAAGLEVNDTNLVIRAAHTFGASTGAAITLTKNLPVASGIGGGSADAAATLHALSNLWHVPLPDWCHITALGADVGVCMTDELTRMSGIGDELGLLGPTPEMHVLLVNPGAAVSTPAIFGALNSKTNPPMSDPMPSAFDRADWINWLAAQRNDLEQAAIHLVPEISTVLKEMRAQDGCDLARMSGSGATCFALFKDQDTCEAAQNALAQTHPGWWVQATKSVSI